MIPEKKSNTTRNPATNPLQNALRLQGEREDVDNQRVNSPRAFNAITQTTLQNTVEVKSLFESWLITYADSQLIYSGMLYDFSLRSVLLLRLVSKTLCNFIANLKINQTTHLLDLLVSKINFSFQIIKIFPEVENNSLMSEQLEFCNQNGIKIALNIFGSSDIVQLQKQILETPASVLFSQIDSLNFFFRYANEKTINAINGLLAIISENTHLCSNIKKLFFHGLENIELPSFPQLVSLFIDNFNITLQKGASLEHIKDLNIVSCKGDPGLLSSFPNLESLSFKRALSYNGFPAHEEDEGDLAEAEEREAIEFAAVIEQFEDLGKDWGNPFEMGVEDMPNLNFALPKQIEPTILTLPTSLNSLKNLHIENFDNESMILVLPEGLINLRTLTIGERVKNIRLPVLYNLESFNCTILSESIWKSLRGSLDTLTNFTCEFVEDAISIQFVCSLRNLRNLSISVGHLKSLILPNTMDKLTHVNIESISQKACMEFPELLSSLVELKIGEICRNGSLKLPDQLANLTSLVIGRIHDTAVLELPNRIDNLKTLHIENIHSKFKLINSPNEVLEFISLLPNLINLESLTIANKEKAKKSDYNSDEEYGEYSYEEVYDEYDDSWRTYKHAKSVIDILKVHNLNLPITLTEVTIQAVRANLILHSGPESHLTTLIIENVSNNASCFLQGSFNNFTSLTIGAIDKNILFQLEGSCNNLQSLTINYIRENATFEIISSLDELVTLQIDDICNEWYENQDHIYEEIDDYYSTCDYYGRSANHITIPDPYHKGGALKLLGQLPKLQHLIIKGEHAVRDEEGRFYIETDEDAIIKLLEIINAKIS